MSISRCAGTLPRNQRTKGRNEDAQSCEPGTWYISTSRSYVLAGEPESNRDCTESRAAGPSSLYVLPLHHTPNDQWLFEYEVISGTTPALAKI